MSATNWSFEPRCGYRGRRPGRPSLTLHHGAGESEPDLTRPPALNHLSLVSRHTADSVIVIVGGELDIATASTLERDVRSAEDLAPRRVVLDLADVAFMDAAGLHVLMAAQHRASASGHKLVLTRVPANVRRLFGLAGVADLFTIGLGRSPTLESQ